VPLSEKTTLAVFSRLASVPAMIAQANAHMPAADGQEDALARWMATFNALSVLEFEVALLVDEAKAIIKRDPGYSQNAALHSGSTPACDL